MKFSISVHSDDGAQIDYSVDLLSAANAVSFINGWQAQQEAAQHRVQRTAEPLCQVCLMPLSQHVHECVIPSTRRR